MTLEEYIDTLKRYGEEKNCLQALVSDSYDHEPPEPEIVDGVVVLADAF